MVFFAFQITNFLSKKFIFFLSFPSNLSVKNFLNKLVYQQGVFEDAETYERLAERLIAMEQEFGRCSNKLFYLAVPPVSYETIL